MFNANKYSTKELIERELKDMPYSETKDNIIGFALQLVENEAYYVAEAVAEAILYYKDDENDTQSVQCNMCMWRGDEDDLTLEKEEDETFKACPNCKTDAYLMDLPVGGVPCKA